MSNLKVLIVGASIAGPTAAYWFARAGATVTVIERWPTLRPGGQNVDIRTAGVTVMRRMPGMEPAVRASDFDLDGLTFLDPNGRLIARMQASGSTDAQSLVSEFEIPRGDLARVLYGLTKDNERTRYVFGEQVASIEHHGDTIDGGPISVEFAHGSPRADFDLVVACDGATSRTRAIGFNCGVWDHIKTINSWAAYFSVKEDLVGGSKWGQGFSTVGGRFLAIKANDTGGTDAIMMAIKPRNGTDATLPFRQAQKEGEEALKRYVAQYYRGAGWKTDAVVDGMMDSKNFYASEMVQVKVPKLCNGRFVLVGDAGYAAGPTGHGTSLAMVGAYVLAGEVAAHPGDLAAGLKAYEERMAPIITDMQKIPPGVPNLAAPQTMLGIRIRNLLFMLVSWAMSFGSKLSWLGGLVGRFWASAFGADKYNLPEYRWSEQDRKSR